MYLQYYIDKFQNLNTNSINGRNSPHKVCMLLAVMKLIDEGIITQNRIVFDDLLKASFSECFAQMRQANDRNTPENPFYHLKTEGFWHLVYHPGVDSYSVKRFSAKTVSHVRLDDELFDYMRSPIAATDLKDALTNNLSNLSDLFSNWLIGLGKSEKTAKNYLQALQSSIPRWMAEKQLIELQPLTKIRSYQQFHALVERTRQLDEFKIRNTNGNGMYSAALNAYSRFLADIAQVDLKQDVEDILEDNALSATEKSILVSTRLGQGHFREQLIRYWHGHCAVTGYSETQMLVASHIKPWRDANNRERLNPYNGLLLLANIDKAFDLGFISFQDSGKVMIARQLEDPEVLGIRDDMAVNLHREHKPFLSHHRMEIFRGF
ncbi:HNH endonuclease [Photobacterium ganghwense]|uniref:Restriction endonuclease n=1 Tax=Photobacterium ganghwense TaxID=320778 RepID=A0A0J1H7G0_9GAMM|nr:HNH endonuclease [Photobacterium ganghwense]KLV07665.1 restriction endonuclease [Photobacterium ganghwense]PSU11482.1 HNH endonuclease [Photobacterium ganghwense]QSV13596.1 HNH endonuclease [Photobacterium ganghwense]